MTGVETASRCGILTALAGGLLLLAGCNVGPDYVPPVTEAAADWYQQLPPGLKAEPDDLRQWWTRFQDPLINELVAKLTEDNLDLAAARGRIGEARARAQSKFAARLPDLVADGSYEGSRISENVNDSNLSGNSLGHRDLFSAGLDMSWELDLFGGLRRDQESAEADLEAAAEDFGDVLISLQAEVARTCIEARVAQRRLAVAARNVELQSRTLTLVTARVESGIAPEADQVRAAQNLATTRSEVPPIRSELEQALHRLAILVGEAPGWVQQRWDAAQGVPRPPESGVGVPVDTVRQRPDIRRAERRLAAQTARIGVATAELYPKFSFSARLDQRADDIGILPESTSRAYSFGPSFSWNLFNFGEIQALIRVEDARARTSLAEYRQTVLRAFEEVENALVAYAQDQLRAAQLDMAQEQAARSVELIRVRYEQGLEDFLPVLDAQRQLFTLQDTAAVTRGRLASDLVTLFKALGGSWSTQRETLGDAAAAEESSAP